MGGGLPDTHIDLVSASEIAPVRAEGEAVPEVVRGLRDDAVAQSLQSGSGGRIDRAVAAQAKAIDIAVR